MPSEFHESFDRDGVVITDIEPDDNTSLQTEEIDFTPRDNPDVSVDTGARFSKHEILGGPIVRQKIGEEPLNISIRGVCDESTAKQLDTLRRAKSGVIECERIIARVQFASVSTDPMESGGAADVDTGEYLYNYRLNMVSIYSVEDASSGGGGGGGGIITTQ